MKRILITGAHVRHVFRGRGFSAGSVNQGMNSLLGIPSEVFFKAYYSNLILNFRNSFYPFLFFLQYAHLSPLFFTYLTLILHHDVASVSLNKSPAYPASHFLMQPDIHVAASHDTNSNRTCHAKKLPKGFWPITVAKSGAKLRGLFGFQSCVKMICTKHLEWCEQIPHPSISVCPFGAERIQHQR